MPGIEDFRMNALSGGRRSKPKRSIVVCLTIFVVGWFFPGSLAADGPSSSLKSSRKPLTAEGFLNQASELVKRGPEFDRVWLGCNFLHSQFMSRYPHLKFAAELGGVRPFESRFDFARVLLGNASQLGIKMDDDLLRILATWIRRGRLPFADVSMRQIATSQEWRTLAPWPGEDLDWLLRELYAADTANDPGSGQPTTGAGSLGVAKRKPHSGLQTRNQEGDRVERRSSGGFRLDLRVTPQVLRSAILLIEDFLVCYGQTEPGKSLSPQSLDRFGQVLADGAKPWPRDLPRPSFGEIEPDAEVVRGLENLFGDLVREFLGFDTRECNRLVEALPQDEASVIAIAGYTLEEMAGSPFHRVATDVAQLAQGVGSRIVWLEREEDLNRLLLDPSIRRMLLWGHGSFDGYSFFGLTGRPEETVSRLLIWARCHAEELALRINRLWEKTPSKVAARGISPTHDLLRFIQRGLDQTYAGWSMREFRALTQTDGFRKKDRITFWACGIDELEVRDVPPTFEEALTAELEVDPQEGAWLGVGRSSSSGVLKNYKFYPLSPSCLESFQREFPGLMRRVRTRLGQPFLVTERADFLDLLSEESSRFPGLSWISDFMVFPLGMTWDSAKLVESLSDLGG